jgi:TolA-binding protein
MDGKSFLIGALAVGMAGTAWYAYETSHPSVVEGNPQITQAPPSTAPAPAGHIEKGEVREFRAQSRDQNERIQQLNDQARDLEGKLAQTARDKDVDRARVAELENELAKTNKQLEGYRAASQEVARKINDQNRPAQKVKFDVGVNQQQDIGQGVAIYVNRTDPESQLFTARVWFQPENRMFALRGQGTNSPLVFYALRDGKKYEVVVESVRDNSISGYVMVPL